MDIRMLSLPFRLTEVGTYIKLDISAYLILAYVHGRMLLCSPLSAEFRAARLVRARLGSSSDVLGSDERLSVGAITPPDIT